MGYFKNQYMEDRDVVDKDPQKYCASCNEMISDNEATKYKGKCESCSTVMSK